jgi:malonyl CoA-acyl carrier protein transacylase
VGGQTKEIVSALRASQRRYSEEFMNKKIGALFPGQGSQSVGMIKVLFEQFPETKKYFEEASDALNLNLGRLCLEGPEETLALTQNAQPAILVTSYSWFKVAEDRIGLTPIAGAGHSLGEYSALLCSGAFSLSEGASIVQKRGMLMQEAVPVGKGKMAAVLGLEDAKERVHFCYGWQKRERQGHPLTFPGLFIRYRCRVIFRQANTDQ